jgi:hypothetical protein
MTAPKLTEATFRARAWTGHGISTIRAMLSDDGAVLVWDDVAHHYTRHHALTVSAQRRIRAALRGES